MKQYILKYKSIMFGIIIFTIISSVITILTPLFVGNIINSLVDFDMQIFINSLTILICIYILLFLSNIMQAMFLSHLTSVVSNNIRSDLFRKINKIKLKEIDKIQYGEIINKFSVDVENIPNGLILAISKIINGIIVVILVSIIVIKLNYSLAIILFIMAPLMYIISKNVTEKTRKYFNSRASVATKLNSLSEEYIMNEDLIHSYNYEIQVEKNFREVNKDLYEIGLKSQFYSSLTNPSTRLISNIGYIIIGIFGIMLLIAKKIIIGKVTSFLMYANVFTRPFNEITLILSELQTSMASYRKIKEFLDKDEEEDIKEINIKNNLKINGKVEFKNVNFSYTNKKFIENMNFKVEPGEKIAIVGKTGSGKTTIVNLLMKFYEIDSGNIYIDGIDIKDFPREFLRSNIGMILQDTKIFTGTVKENITYGTEKVTDEKVKEVSRLAYANSFIERLPNKYETIISNGTLSEGEVQLITMARAMILNPPILILDEATSNIDLITESKIQKSMLELINNSTTFIIAHRLSTIINSDRIFYIEHGNIVEQGTHEELLKKQGKYYELYNSQF